MGAFLDGLLSLKNKAELGLEQYGPTAMIIGGVILMVGGAVVAAIETPKAEEIVTVGKKEIDEIRDALNHPEKRADDYTEKDAKRDMTKAYFRTVGKLALNYAPAIIAEVAGGSLVLGGTKVINNRLAITGAALSTALSEFDEYRKNTIEKFGDDGKKIDGELRYGLKTGEIKEKVVDENGKEKTVKKKVAYLDENFGEDGYRRVFDCRNTYWDHHPDYALMFLSAKQNLFNDQLRAKGFVFLNDVLKELGFEPTKQGQIVGWVYDPNNDRGDNYIDFDVLPVRIREFNGKEYVENLECPERNCGFALNFNVDGSILDRVNWSEKNEPHHLWRK